jgi:hypothetical protein
MNMPELETDRVPGKPAGTGAKRENHDELLEIMRRVLKENPGIRQSGAVRIWLENLHNHDDYNANLGEAAESYAGSNIYRRLIQPAAPSIDEKSEREDRLKKAKEILASNIILWRWKLPTVGKLLPDCSFGELNDAAPVVGKFIAKLSACGAPGTLVRDVFRNEKSLQEFWTASQE